MRVYRLLVATFVTAGAVYLAAIAAQSRAVARARPSAVGRDSAVSDRIWYGGRLAPVTVEASRARHAAESTGLVRSHAGAAHPTRPAATVSDQ